MIRSALSSMINPFARAIRMSCSHEEYAFSWYPAWRTRKASVGLPPDSTEMFPPWILYRTSGSSR